jgi:hypothetical protein
MNTATEFTKVRFKTATAIGGLAGCALTVQFEGHQVAIVGATPEGAAAAFKKLTGGLAPSMDGAQKVVLVSATSAGAGDA